MNYPPLVIMGVEPTIAWQKFLPSPSQPLSCAQNVSEHVAVFRFFPGFTTQSLENLLQPPLQGLVLSTFGAGNAPDSRLDMLKVLSKASERGVVLINVTQCSRGKVEAHYAAGTALLEAGVVPGYDLTVEAALAKLACLLGKGLPPAEVRELMATDMCGELTSDKEYQRFSLHTSSFIKAVHSALIQTSADTALQDAVSPSSPVKRKKATEMAFIGNALSPVLLCSAAAIGEHDEIQSLLEESAMDPNAADYDKRTPLHVAAAGGDVEAVRVLISMKASVNVVDRWHVSPCRSCSGGT
jgi:lysophospholipase